LLIGTNNLGHGTANAAQTFSGICAVVAKIHLQVPNARILLCSIFPREENMNALRGDVAQVNQVLASAFANDSSVRIIDLCTSFIGVDGKIPARLMPDFLHLTPAGYQVWADGIRAPLEDALKK
jgi:lysophospholipase L1-like esterase